MKLLQVSLFSIFFLIGCNKIEGQLNITKDFQLKNTDGKLLSLRVGTYSADIKANTSKKITLRLNNNSDQKFIFNHSGNIPENGTFAVPASVSKQPVGLSGTVDTNVVDSPIKQTTESCTYQVSIPVCYPSPTGGMSCGTQEQTTYGTQWIKYYDRQITKNIDLLVKTADEVNELADFHGSITNVQRIVLDRSMCH